MMYRDEPHGSRAKDFSTLTEAFVMRTPDWPFTKGREPVLARHLFLQIRQRAGSSASTNKLAIQAYVDGEAVGTAEEIAPVDSPPKLIFKRIDLGKKVGRTWGFKASTTVPAGGGALYDIENAIPEIQIDPAR
jgi:hypothetical protein